MGKIKTKAIPLKLNKINQFNEKTNSSKGVYNATWRLIDFIKSLKFTQREPLNYNIFQDDANLFNQDSKKYPEFNTDYYQRLINDEKTKKVILFLIKELKTAISNPNDYLITFPTSLIFSLYTSELNSKEEYLEYLEETEFNEDDFNENVGVYITESEILLPNLNILLVVDGQHRLAGLLAIYYSLLSEIEGNHLNKKLIDFARKCIEKEEFNNYDELKIKVENFVFNCMVLLDFDVWEQGKVFADVNFNQKPVNKSLYYDIFGSYPDTENNDLYIAHQWVTYLNNKSGSPFCKKIKMLGSGEGYISQAFLVESFFPLLRRNGVWNVFLNESISNKALSERPIIFLEIYFDVIKELLKEFWPIEGDKPSLYKHILFKTTGLAALIKLVEDIYPKVENFVYKGNEKELADKIKLEFQNSDGTLKFNPIRLFSKDGDFSKGAGKGLQVRLYKQLAYDLGYRTSPII
ncbi:ParB N-terminal domain-containing protein [Flavobacterium commune]|uniref:DGQHR domain-containing protein n=1 Tax=Flavobacterium commune TaxID=1306519 RepID=A0A1D9PCB2_9FLAO|nr:hypothetical protein [Flavobacterium commune]APA00217.1 hypothetical protein BIW12_12700 [Flavobacterium commune]